MSLERAKIVLKDIYSRRKDNCSECHLLDGKSVNDALLYRLTFDEEEDDINNQQNDVQYFNLDKPSSSSSSPSSLLVKHGGNHNMINVVGSTKGILGKSNCVSDYSDEDQMRSNDIRTEPESQMFKSTASLILNVSSLADEIIDAEIGSLKGLQATTLISSSSASSRATTSKPIGEDKLSIVNGSVQYNHLNHDGNDRNCCSSASMINKNDNDDTDSTRKIEVSKTRSEESKRARKRRKSLFLPVFMRNTINTETQFIAYDYPSTRACLSCCSIS